MSVTTGDYQRAGELAQRNELPTGGVMGTTEGKLRPQLALVCALLLGACQAADGQLLASGPDSTIDSSKIRMVADKHTETLGAISDMAGLGGRAPTSSGEWRSFVFAGINYVDGECNRYLSALDRFYRAKNATTQQLALTGAATLGILGVVGAAAQAIAITGIAFGLASSTVDNLSKGVIYELPATTVIQLVRDLQQSYKAGIPETGYTDRASAFLAIQGYIEICLPINIETQVANAVKIARPESRAGDTEKGLPPVVQIGPITTMTYGADTNSAILRAYLFKADNTTVDPDKRAALVKAMAAVGVTGTSATGFINGKEYQSQRAKVVSDLKLK